MLDFNKVTEGLTREQIRNCVNQTTLNFIGGMAKMAIYTGKQSILDEALGEYAQAGFRLEEPDDHFTDLYFKDKRIARFNQTKITIEIIREGCENYLASILRSL